MSRDGKLRRKRPRRLVNVFKKASISAIAKSCGISRQAVSLWKIVPTNHIFTVKRLTGLPLHEIRPDLYGPLP